MNGDSTRKHGGFTRNGDLGKNAGFELQKKPALSNHQDKTSGGCYVTILLLASQAMCIASVVGSEIFHHPCIGCWEPPRFSIWHCLHP